MIQSETERQLNFFDASNDLVPCVLGMMNLLDELAAYAVLEEIDTDPADRSEVGEDLLVYALLGLLSVRQTLFRWLEPELRSRIEAPPSSSPGPLERMLR